MHRAHYLATASEQYKAGGDQGRRGDLATHLLKLGCPGVWLFGAALLPWGGVGVAMGGPRAAARLWAWSMEAIWLMGRRL